MKNKNLNLTRKNVKDMDIIGLIIQSKGLVVVKLKPLL